MNDEFTPVQFDYNGLPTEVVQRSKMRAKEIKQDVGNIFWSMMRIGKVLTEQRQELANYGNGTFNEWMEQEARIPKSSGYEAISVYELGDSLSAEQTNYFEAFPRKVLTALAASSTPPEVREFALQKAQNGESVTEKEVKAWKRRCEEAETKLSKCQQFMLEAQKEASRQRSLQHELGETVRSYQEEDERKSKRIRELDAVIRELENREPEIVNNYIPTLPPGYASAEEALAAMQQEIEIEEMRRVALRERAESELAELRKQIEESERKAERSRQKAEAAEESERHKQVAAMTKTLRRQIAEAIKTANQIGQLTKQDDAKNAKLRSALVAAIQDAINMKNLLSGVCPVAIEAGQEQPAIDVAAM